MSKKAEPACTGLTGVFFSDNPDLIEVAKSYCRSCPRRTACLAGALSRAEPAGVWGGEEFQAGRVVVQHRRRGRPARQLVGSA